MKNVFTTISNLIKFEKNYHYLKKLNPEKYNDFLINEYKKRTEEDLNLTNPKKYTEKMQYAKLYLNTPLKAKLTDKYLVREWISNKIGSEYLIPLLGVWDSFNEIDFDSFPSKFVLKANHGSGTNIIVEDKSHFNYGKAKFHFNRWLNKNYAFWGEDLQLHYKNIKPKIIAEEYLQDSNGEFNDYKFLCFNGQVHYCWVDVGRFTNHYRNVYDLDWNLQPWNQNTYANTPYEVSKPENFDAMVDIATKLCQGFSHVRVDLYNVDGKIYFGEMTFTNAGGYKLIYPEEYNYQLGDLWDIKNIT